MIQWKPAPLSSLRKISSTPSLPGRRLQRRGFTASVGHGRNHVRYRPLRRSRRHVGRLASPISINFDSGSNRSPKCGHRLVQRFRLFQDLRERIASKDIPALRTDPRGRGLMMQTSFRAFVAWIEITLAILSSVVSCAHTDASIEDALLGTF
jgi:hypothetical protein